MARACLLVVRRATGGIERIEMAVDRHVLGLILDLHDVEPVYRPPHHLVLGCTLGPDGGDCASDGGFSIP